MFCQQIRPVSVRVARVVGAALLAAALGPVSGAAEPEENSMEEQCRLEVVELHQFFQDWFNAALESSDESFARFADVIDEDFVIISPNGVMTARGPLVDRLRKSYGGSKTGEGDTGARIWIENYRLHRVAGDLAVVTYEEWQDLGGEVRGRLSSAVFGRREGTPNGVVWLHLHEVWMP